MATITRFSTPESQIILAESRLSAEVWASMPATTPQYELIQGELKRKMPTKRMHARAAFRLAHLLTLWSDSSSLGWDFHTEGLGLRADNFNGFVPDVIGFAPGTAPDGEVVYASSAFLIAEVLSPATAANDRDEKKRGYARAEVELYLIVDPANRTLEIYRLDGQIYGAPEVLGSHAVWQPAEFEGLQLDLSKLWL